MNKESFATNTKRAGHLRGQSGVKAIETGARLLVALTKSAHPQMLKTIAAQARMHPAKAHRYLTSFIRVGLVDRDPGSSRYCWGPLALDIGLATLAAIDVVGSATPEVIKLRDETGATIALAVWGTHGPTFVLTEESSRSVIVKSRPGTVLPMTTSATGRVFAAFLPAGITRKIIRSEFTLLEKDATARKKRRHDFELLLNKVRAFRMGWALGEYSPGVHALSSPVIDRRGAIVAAVTMLAPAGDFDPDLDGPTAARLREATTRISHLLGQRSGI